MFWFGLTLTVIMGLAGIPLIRDLVCGWFKISEKLFCIIRTVLVFTGAIIAGTIYIQTSQEVAQQKHITDAMREYSVVARLNPHGVTGMAGQGLKETPHSRLAGLEETWILHENNWSPKCDDPSIEKSREVVTSFPQFPWTHFLLAVCLREKGDQAWRGYTERAVQIFEHTTSLADHHSVHDKALKKLRELLNTK